MVPAFGRNAINTYLWERIAVDAMGAYKVIFMFS